MSAQEVAALLLAARKGDLETLKSDKVTEAVKDDHHANCLHYASRGGNLPAVQYLVTQKGFDPTARSNVGATPLHDAAVTGQLSVLQWLLGLGDSRVDDAEVTTGATVAHLAARYGHTQMLEWLLDETNCDVLKKSETGALALHFAAEGGHVDCVKLLLAEAPRSVNMQMNSGATPAYMACQQGQLEVAEVLAAKNGTPKIHSFDGMSTLHAAAQSGHLHMVQWLVKEQQMNPNERDFDGATPLHYAASNGHDHVVDWLMKEGGARIILDNVGGSPLHTAAEFGNNKIVRTLLKNGCDSTITDNEGLTASELAEKCGHTKTAAILRGEIVHEQDEEDRSPPGLHPLRQTLPSHQTSQYAAASSTTHQSLTQSAATAAPSLPSPVARRGGQGLSRLQDSLENLGIGRLGGSQRPTSVDSVASSESSFGYFPWGGGRTETVTVDIHNTFDQASTASIDHTASKPAAGEVPSSSTSVSSSRQPAVRSAFISKQHSSVASGITTVSDSSSKRSSASSGIEGRAPERTELKETKSPFEHWTSAVYISGNMEDRVNGNVKDSSGSSSPASTTNDGSAKSVIKINSNNVTIISTGKDGSSKSKMMVTPLRSGNDDRHMLSSSSHVSTRKKDAEFINALSQKFQNGGPPVGIQRPVSAASLRGPGTVASSLSDDQKKQISSSVAAVGQRRPIVESASAPSLVVNESKVPNGTVGDLNGLSGETSPGDAPPSPVPPPPDQPLVRKADASYTPRPKSSTASANGLGTPPLVNGSYVYQQKNDLMAALTAVVTSGEPSSVLRKTRGPGKGGINEVLSSKKVESTNTPNGNGSTPSLEQFDYQRFLDQVPDIDAAGNAVPDWKKQMMAKKLAQTALEEYLEKKKVEDYEAKFKGMPAWKRALLEKKEGGANTK